MKKVQIVYDAGEFRRPYSAEDWELAIDRRDAYLESTEMLIQLGISALENAEGLDCVYQVYGYEYEEVK